MGPVHRPSEDCLTSCISCAAQHRGPRSSLHQAIALGMETRGRVLAARSGGRVGGRRNMMRFKMNASAEGTRGRLSFHSLSVHRGIHLFLLVCIRAKTVRAHHTSGFALRCCAFPCCMAAPRRHIQATMHETPGPVNPSFLPKHHHPPPANHPASIIQPFGVNFGVQQQTQSRHARRLGLLTRGASFLVHLCRVVAECSCDHR